MGRARKSGGLNNRRMVVVGFLVLFTLSQGMMSVIGNEDTVSDDMWDDDTWRLVDTMPIPRSDLSAVMWNDTKIYVMGGKDNTNETLNTMVGWNPITGVWRRLEPMLTRRSGHAAVTDAAKSYIFRDDQNMWKKVKIYAIGGRDEGDSTLSTVEIYDPTTDIWTAKASMSISRWEHAAATVDGKIYVIGGRDDNDNTLATVEMYDPTINEWTPKASTSIPRWGHATAVVDGKIYVIGGRDDNDNTLATVEMYDSTANEWTPKASMLTIRGNLVAATMGGRFYALGGTSTGHTTLTTVEEYNPVTDTWMSRAAMWIARKGLATTMVGGRIFVLGGCTDDGTCVEEVEEYNPPFYDTDGDELADDLELSLNYASGTNPLNKNTDGDLYTYDKYDPQPTIPGVCQISTDRCVDRKWVTLSSVIYIILIFLSVYYLKMVKLHAHNVRENMVLKPNNVRENMVLKPNNVQKSAISIFLLLAAVFFVVVGLLPTSEFFEEFSMGVFIGSMAIFAYNSYDIDSWVHKRLMRFSYIEYYHWGMICLFFPSMIFWGLGVSLIVGESSNEHRFGMYKYHYAKSMAIGAILFASLAYWWLLLEPLVLAKIRMLI